MRNQTNPSFSPKTQYPLPCFKRTLQTQTLWSQLEYRTASAWTAQSSLRAQNLH